MAINATWIIICGGLTWFTVPYFFASKSSSLLIKWVILASATIENSIEWSPVLEVVEF